MLVFIVISLLFCLAKSVCYTPNTNTTLGHNIIPKKMTFGWLKLQPYNISFYTNNNYVCDSITYYITNITNSGYDNDLYIQLFNANGNNDRIFCHTSCNFTINCEKFHNQKNLVYYFIDQPNLYFDYEIIIKGEIYDRTICIIDIGVFVVVFFVVLIVFIATMCRIRNCRKSDQQYKLLINQNI